MLSSNATKVFTELVFLFRASLIADSVDSLRRRSSSLTADGEASIVTLDSTGRLHFWSLIDIQETENELGIAPEETLKLVKAASVKLSDFGGDVLQQYTSLGVIGSSFDHYRGFLLRESRTGFPVIPASRETEEYHDSCRSRVIHRT